MMTAPTPTNGRSGYCLLTHHLDDHPLLPLPIELRIEDLLPRAEVEGAGGDGHDDLMPHQRTFEMRIRVVLTGLVMPVVETGGRELLQPDLEVVNQPVLPI